jgi:predicted RNA-binding Zn-ribbon protein involved in translation (DUF1610 family)
MDDDPKVKCVGCGWKGRFSELDDDDGKDAFVCPQCGTVAWEWV